jgi:hypothetical protein
MKYIVRLIIALLIIPAGAFAQQKDDGDAAQRMHDKTIQQLMHKHNADRGKIRQMVIWRLIDELDLSEDTSAKFLPVYKEYLERREENMKQSRDLIHKISENANNESVPIKTLREDVQKLTDIDKTLAQEREKFLKKSESILDERQYIKLIIFEDKLKGDFIERFREKRFMIDIPEGSGDIPFPPGLPSVGIVPQD